MGTRHKVPSCPSQLAVSLQTIKHRLQRKLGMPTLLSLLFLLVMKPTQARAGATVPVPWRRGRSVSVPCSPRGWRT